MRKADSLRRWLAACLPELENHPDRLQIYVEGGRVLTRRSATPSFAYAYTLKALITDFAGDANRLMVPVLAWLEGEQPQLLARADNQPFSFEAELLDGDLSDVEIALELTETILVTPRADGSGYDVAPAAEPDYARGFPGGAGLFRQGFGNAEPLAATADPTAAAGLTPAVPPAA